MLVFKEFERRQRSISCIDRGAQSFYVILETITRIKIKNEQVFK